MAWISKTGKVDEMTLYLISSLQGAALKQLVLERQPLQALHILAELKLCNDLRLNALLQDHDVDKHWRKFTQNPDAVEADHHGLSKLLNEPVLDIYKEE